MAAVVTVGVVKVEEGWRRWDGGEGGGGDGGGGDEVVGMVARGRWRR